jgi:hypothetical protein
MRQGHKARRFLFRPVAEMTTQVGVREQAAVICSTWNTEMKASMRPTGWFRARKAQQEMSM